MIFWGGIDFRELPDRMAVPVASTNTNALKEAANVVARET
jgi:hypothetical protein